MNLTTLGPQQLSLLYSQRMTLSLLCALEPHNTQPAMQFGQHAPQLKTDISRLLETLLVSDVLAKAASSCCRRVLPVLQSSVLHSQQCLINQPHNPLLHQQHTVDLPKDALVHVKCVLAARLCLAARHFGTTLMHDLACAAAQP